MVAARRIHKVLDRLEHKLARSGLERDVAVRTRSGGEGLEKGLWRRWVDFEATTQKAWRNLLAQDSFWRNEAETREG